MCFPTDSAEAVAHAAALQDVKRARNVDWGQHVDAYLSGAARVGLRYTGHVYFDSSGIAQDGMVVVTPPCEVISERDGFKLLRSPGGDDHYVVVSEL